MTASRCSAVRDLDVAALAFLVEAATGQLLLACGALDGRVTLWDVGADAAVAHWRAHAAAVNDAHSARAGELWT